MCWECDNPQATRADYLDHLAVLIERVGWAVQHVERTSRTPAWSYTVGLSGHGQPELMVLGMALERSHQLLNGLAEHVLHATAPEPGTQMRLRGGPLVEYVRMSEPSAHLHTAVSLYGAAIRGLQVVHADDRGRWPWDVGYRSGRGGQPVLGKRGRITPAR